MGLPKFFMPGRWSLALCPGKEEGLASLSSQGLSKTTLLHKQQILEGKYPVALTSSGPQRSEQCNYSNQREKPSVPIHVGPAKETVFLKDTCLGCRTILSALVLLPLLLFGKVQNTLHL